MIDIELYGGRRAYIRHLCARALHAFGAYPGHQTIDWRAIDRLTFVCKGNICRSAYAAVRARALGVQAASFGVDAIDGAPADPAAVRNAIPRGVDLTPHRSARLERARIAERDLIIVFEPSQLAVVRERSGARTRVCLLGVWAPPFRPHVQDPYGKSDRYFQVCFSLIDANVAELSRRVLEAHSQVRSTEKSSATPSS